MSTNMPTIITDRTFQDAKQLRDLANKGYANMTADERTIWNSYNKGRFVASDFNRLCGYLNMLIALINWGSTEGIIDETISLSTLKVNWQDGDVVDKAELDKIQTALNFITDYCFEDRIDLGSLNYNSANLLEYVIEKCDTYILVYDNQDNLIKQIDYDLATHISNLSNYPIMNFYTILTNNLTATEQLQAYKIIVKNGFTYSSQQISWNKNSNLKNVRILDLSKHYTDFITFSYYTAQPQYMPILDTITMTDRGSNYNTGVFEGTASNRTPIKNIIFTQNNQCTEITNRFFYCAKLENIQLPPKLKTIGMYSFYSCRELKSIILPKTLTTIKDYAFQGCSILTDFRFEGTMAQWSAISKGTSWKQDSGITQVVCSDGIVNV